MWFHHHSFSDTVWNSWDFSFDVDAEKIFDEDPTPPYRENLHKLKDVYLARLKNEELFWKQKVRIKCIILDDIDDIRAEAINFFTTLFTNSHLPLLSPSSNLFSHITSLVSSHDNNMLHRMPILGEVKEVVFSLNREGAPSPDNCSGAFSVHCWDIVSSNVFHVVGFVKGHNITDNILLPHVLFRDLNNMQNLDLSYSEPSTPGILPSSLLFFLQLFLILSYLLHRLSLLGMMNTSATSIFLPPATPFLPCYMIWDSVMPVKFSIFMWRLNNSILPVDSSLQNISFHLASCCHCNKGEDSIDHIFLTCCYANNLWPRVSKLLGIFRIH
ncbi:hypothetical protein M9H77_06364 [Catharanthus roseus]|uniref:Uncharacterized protein n=1 Tax=Catharanthus roseus TaxID=4058 RepID=A0ACC0BS24_CATRO|nr:hypothetical protein M9H77_06364 [Catharanthus roseus]